MAGYLSSGDVWTTKKNFKEKFHLELPLDLEKSAEVLSTARVPVRGKPLVGKDTRLYFDPQTSDYRLTYRDSEIVTLHADGTITLNHCGYPTLMTVRRIEEYAPLGASHINYTGKRFSREDDEGSFWAWENLTLTFVRPVGIEDSRRDLRQMWAPEFYQYVCELPFPRGRIRIDREGRPVLSSLLLDIIPPEWGHTLGAKIQPWMAAPVFWEQICIPPLSHQRAMNELFQTPGEAADTLVMMRLPWVTTEPIATVWRHQSQGDAPVLYRWIVRERPSGFGDEYAFGESTDLALAVADADRAISDAHWSTRPPELRDVLGNLRWNALALPYLDRSVLRVHWQEPWTTRHRSERVERRPLPGSLPWPGPKRDVRIWFELAGGVAVGIVHKKGIDTVITHTIQQSHQTSWEIPGVLIAGLIAGILAMFG